MSGISDTKSKTNDYVENDKKSITKPKIEEESPEKLNLSEKNNNEKFSTNQNLINNGNLENEMVDGSVKISTKMFIPTFTEVSNKLKDDIERWKNFLLRLTIQTPATEINDVSFLELREKYIINTSKKFSRGNYSDLYICKRDNIDQCCKITPLKGIDIRYKENLLKYAIPIMKYLFENQHPSLVLHYAIYKNPAKLYIFMELINGPNLLTCIMKKDNYSNCFNNLKKLCRDVAEGLNHLYIIGIAHLNIKASNIVLTHDLLNAKICDFNCSMPVYDVIEQKVLLSPKISEWNFNYSPEMQEGPFNPTFADVWALGILIVNAISLETPFTIKTKNYEECLKSHFHRCFVVPDENLLNLLLKCFIVDPKKRINTAEILLHPYFNSNAP